MKKIVGIMLVLSIVLTMFAGCGKKGAEGLIYESRKDAYTVEGYGVAPTIVVIPDTIDGIVVTAIANESFIEI